MRFKGKKPIFSRKDCWSLDACLSHIIGAGLIKFKEEMLRLREENHPYRGTPASLAVEGDFEKGYTKWLTTLDHMIYAFTQEPPTYLDWVEGELHGQVDANRKGCVHFDMKPKDEVQYEKHKKELEAHNKRVAKGKKLFFKHFDDLWW